MQVDMVFLLMAKKIHLTMLLQDIMVIQEYLFLLIVIQIHLIIVFLIEILIFLIIL